MTATHTVIVEIDGEQWKPCSKCGEMLPLSRFVFNTNNRAYTARCRPCRNTDYQERRRRFTPEQRAKTTAQTIAAQKRWAERNPEKAQAKRRRRNADRRAKTRAGNVSAAEWVEIVAAWHGQCAYCGASEEITMDHVIPLSRGGSHTIENVVPCCKPCNCKKRDQTGREFCGVA